MIQNRIPMTRGKYEEMQEELEALRQREPEAIDPARDRRRIRELEGKIRRAEVVSPEARDRVFFGARVKVRELERGRVLDYVLVGPEEIDPAEGRISSASPIGRSLLGRGVGEVVAAQLPRGRLRMEIMDFY